MTGNGLLQIVLYLVIITLLVKPLGLYMAKVYEGKSFALAKLIRPIETLFYRLCRIDPNSPMDWKQYLKAMLLFNLLGILALYFIQRLQFYLPFNPQSYPGVSPALSFNTAVGFNTNSDWQAYSGEATLSYLTQMLGLTVQNFLSAATGMSLVLALIRGLKRHETQDLGNFWVDMVRSVLYILLPLAFIFAIILTSQGVIQNVKPYQKASSLQPQTHEQIIPMGPAASQIAIKQLGTNGGGFFNANSAHPFENPTPLSNFLEMLAILLIPAAFCYTFGCLIKDKRQGWSIFIAMMLLFLPFMSMGVVAEHDGNPALTSLPIEQAPGTNMEGKETRFGVANSALWAAGTTATGNGSMNAMFDSFTPLGGFVPLWFMHLGEVVFGGVGSGLYGMLMLVIITVFIAGLMVGRTPEYLGKKIEPFEMKMASISVLLMPMAALILTAVAVVTPFGVSSIGNPKTHGFSEILYAFTSMGNNNGSILAGLNVNTPFYNIAGGIEMIFLRYWTAIPVLAIAGSLARKKIIPDSAGTLPTHTTLFIILLISVTIILGALTFLPSLALGPIVEHLMLGELYGG